MEWEYKVKATILNLNLVSKGTTFMPKPRDLAWRLWYGVTSPMILNIRSFPIGFFTINYGIRVTWAEGWVKKIGSLESEID
jgi:hypothetical protein